MTTKIKSLFERADNTWPIDHLCPALFEQGVLIFEWAAQTFMIERKHEEGDKQCYLVWVTLSTGAYQSSIVSSFIALLNVTPFDLSRFRFASNDVCIAYQLDIADASRTLVESTGEAVEKTVKLLRGKGLQA